MDGTQFLVKGQSLVLDVPAPVRAAMPARHFTLAAVDGHDALLRTKGRIAEVIAGVPVTLSVGTSDRLLEGFLVGASPPDGLTVRLATVPDRRTHTRVALTVPVEFEALEGSDIRPIRGMSINVSQGGVLVRTTEPLEPGMRAFTVIGAGIAASIMAITEVASCGIEPGSSAYLIRAPFTSIADAYRVRLASWMAR